MVAAFRSHSAKLSRPGEEPKRDAALNAFAADVANRLVLDAPIAQAAVIRKAEAFGIDIG